MVTAGIFILFPKNNAFKKSLLVPYQVPRKFGLSENMITLPDPSDETRIAAEFFTFLAELECR